MQRPSEETSIYMELDCKVNQHCDTFPEGYREGHDDVADLRQGGGKGMYDKQEDDDEKNVEY